MSNIQSHRKQTFLRGVLLSVVGRSRERETAQAKGRNAI